MRGDEGHTDETDAGPPDRRQDDAQHTEQRETGRAPTPGDPRATTTGPTDDVRLDAGTDAGSSRDECDGAENDESESVEPEGAGRDPAPALLEVSPTHVRDRVTADFWCTGEVKLLPKVRLTERFKLLRPIKNYPTRAARCGHPSHGRGREVHVGISEVLSERRAHSCAAEYL